MERKVFTHETETLTVLYVVPFNHPPSYRGNFSQQQQSNGQTVQVLTPSPSPFTPCQDSLERSVVVHRSAGGSCAAAHPIVRPLALVHGGHSANSFSTFSQLLFFNVLKEIKNSANSLLNYIFQCVSQSVQPTAESTSPPFPSPRPSFFYLMPSRPSLSGGRGGTAGSATEPPAPPLDTVSKPHKVHKVSMTREEVMVLCKVW